MNINEIQGDLFKVPETVYLAHCISRDYKMGAGIAIEFNRKFSLRAKLSRIRIGFPDCILVDKVFNLITKEKYWHKPTYETMHKSLEKMKEICLEKDVKKIAMPKIGCGLDSLSWNHVKRTINDVFKDTDIQIDVYYLD
jgi:O-acetyl-ADP-ribose deacetylase (regulator of RNase III)